MGGCLSSAPHWGTWPATQACALTGNLTGDSLVPLWFTRRGAQSSEPQQPGLHNVLQVVNSSAILTETLLDRAK